MNKYEINYKKGLDVKSEFVEAVNQEAAIEITAIKTENASKDGFLSIINHTSPSSNQVPNTNTFSKSTMVCIDCGYEGLAIQKSRNFIIQLMEVIFFLFLLAFGILPGILYALIVHKRTTDAKEKRFCQACGSSAIHLKAA